MIIIIVVMYLCQFVNLSRYSSKNLIGHTGPVYQMISKLSHNLLSIIIVATTCECCHFTVKQPQECSMLDIKSITGCISILFPVDASKFTLCQLLLFYLAASVHLFNSL